MSGRRASLGIQTGACSGHPAVPQMEGLWQGLGHPGEASWGDSAAPSCQSLPISGTGPPHLLRPLLLGAAGSAWAGVRQGAAEARPHGVYGHFQDHPAHVVSGAAVGTDSVAGVKASRGRGKAQASKISRHAVELAVPCLHTASLISRDSPSACPEPGVFGGQTCKHCPPEHNAQRLSLS